MKTQRLLVAVPVLSGLVHPHQSHFRASLDANQRADYQLGLRGGLSQRKHLGRGGWWFIRAVHRLCRPDLYFYELTRPRRREPGTLVQLRVSRRPKPNRKMIVAHAAREKQR